jgi:hypothetical protein
MHLKRRVDDLLDVARVATHKIQLHKERGVLADIDPVKPADPDETLEVLAHRRGAR